MLPVLDFALQLALGIALNAWVVRRDMRRLARLAPARYARSWNTASFWSAIVGFGPLAVVVHFVRTRRSAWGLLLGVLWAAAVVLALGLVGEAVAALAE